MEGTAGDPWEAARARSRARRAQARARARRRRRRLIVVGGAGVLAFAGGVAVGAGGGDGGGTSGDGTRAARRPPPPPPELPGGGRTIFPDRRVVAYYGTSGTAVLGTLGRGTPDQAGRRLMGQARAYRTRRRPVLPAFELIATVASSFPGPDGLYRNRRPLADVRRYLRAARRIGALLVIDVQPGRADFFAEARRYAALLREPDVSLALDPEWSMGPGQVPGQVIGHTDAATVNRISAWLAELVRRHRLPQKLLVVHQFTEQMIADRPAIRRRPGLAVTLNVDGFGTQADKRARYRALRPRPPLYAGFKLFYTQDVGLLRPGQVLRLHPRPLFVVYQ